MPKGKHFLRGESPDKQSAQRTALALAGEPLREADDQASPEPVAGAVPRRRPGRGNEVSPAEARAIQRYYLTAPTTSQEELKARFGRSRDTIRRVLHDPSFEALRTEFERANAIEARAVLAGATTRAAEAWVSSLEPAARRGDHRPAAALLYSTRTVDPPSQQGTGPSVQVFVGQMVVNGNGERPVLPEADWDADPVEPEK